MFSQRGGFLEYPRIIPLRQLSGITAMVLLSRSVGNYKGVYFIEVAGGRSFLRLNSRAANRALLMMDKGPILLNQAKIALR